MGADKLAAGRTRASVPTRTSKRWVARPEPVAALGVVAPPERIPPAALRTPRRRPGDKGWPSYQRCIENAPPARDDGRPDISRADFTFCLLALDWGWGVEETAAGLMQESPKAREEGETYTPRTARNAEAALEQRGGRLR